MKTDLAWFHAAGHPVYNVSLHEQRLGSYTCRDCHAISLLLMEDDHAEVDEAMRLELSGTFLQHHKNSDA